LPVHDFIAKGMEQKEVDFEKWLMSYDISSFQNIRKIYEAVEVQSRNFIAKSQRRSVQYFLDIVLERDVRNQAGMQTFEFFGIKCENSIPSPEGNNAVAYDDT
jgi:hypothetical protein